MMPILPCVKQLFRAYINVKGFDSLYLRIAQHRIGKEVVRTLDISSIEVSEKLQNQGLFKALLKHCEASCIKHGLGMYVECISNPHLEAYMKKQGYVSDDVMFGPSFGKMCSQLKIDSNKINDDFQP
jgi:ribosomal protein S18 acetylase RimI-like enzyme